MPNRTASISPLPHLSWRRCPVLLQKVGYHRKVFYGNRVAGRTVWKVLHYLVVDDMCYCVAHMEVKVIGLM